MSLPKLEFTKNWTNPEDFPTFEDNEAQVRADIQLLFDQCRDGINRLAEEVTAENVPFRRSPGIDAVTVQNALEVLRDEITGVTLGQLPDGSVTGAKLENGSVTGEKLAGGSVTREKLTGGSVTEEKIAEGSVTEGKLADGSVTKAKLAPDALTGKADLGSDGKLLPEQGCMGIVNVTASRALALADAGKLLSVNQSADVTVTVPLNSTAAFPMGTEIELYRAGAGQVTLNAASGVTLQGAASPLAVPARYARMRLKKVAVNVWAVGDCVLLADGSVTSAKIADGTIATGDLADGAVTLAKTTGIQQKHAVLTVALAVASWAANNTVTVNAAGVTASNTVIVSPAPASWKVWCEAGVRCTAQAAGKLTFTAESKPTAALTAQVMILN